MNPDLETLAAYAATLSLDLEMHQLHGDQCAARHIKRELRNLHTHLRAEESPRRLSEAMGD
jgi:hypothetical protein